MFETSDKRVRILILLNIKVVNAEVREILASSVTHMSYDGQLVSEIRMAYNKTGVEISFQRIVKDNHAA